MSLAIIHSRALTIASAPEVTVEVYLANGLPTFTIVGLPDTEVRESRERVRAALQNCRFEFPIRRITVNLAPADLPKESGRFDLPIALGILVASGQLPAQTVANSEFAGELSLTGTLRPMRGAFAMACDASKSSKQINQTRQATKRIFLPLPNAKEAAFVPNIEIYGVPDLPTLYAHLQGSSETRLQPTVNTFPKEIAPLPDMSEVVGQFEAKRALEVAAAGAHHLLMIGPPGAGKSMLAARLAGILPLMSEDEALASASLLSVSPQGFNPIYWRRRPFRSPHHSASAAALVGGGNPPTPGEITLAHNGVLFLDELPEFNRQALEMLREPLETQHITIARAGHQAEFPAACQLIAAMNPCPCGWHGDVRGRCRCSPDIARRYRQRISGPLLDRIDIQLEIPALAPHELIERTNAPAESTENIAKRVQAARDKQLERQQQSNNALTPSKLEKFCQLDDDGRALLSKAFTRFGWSARGHTRVLKVARTIADLANSNALQAAHIAEAIQYRRFS